MYLIASIPDSAISSWGGFVYQGKVALYHSITLILDEQFNGFPIADFSLQLDSTDDFAIYVGADAISVHQVKAKSSSYRSTFETALEKSSKVVTDCTPTTSRYFHVAEKLNDDTDYKNAAGGVVKFYEYENGEKFCPLSDIEAITKSKIQSYLTKQNLPATNILIEKKYCCLSELISSHVIKVHALIHAGATQNNAAYNNVINSGTILQLLERNYNDDCDEEYVLLKLRSAFADTFEEYIADEQGEFGSKEVERSKLVFDFIYSLDNLTLKSVLASLRPHNPTDVLRVEDIQNYADIIMAISREMILADLPHYRKGDGKYLPTAMRIDQPRASYYRRHLNKQISTNPHLVNLLFEFDTFIATGNLPNLIVEEDLEKITDAPGMRSKSKDNIVKMVSLRVISKDVAQGELNA